MTNLAARLKDQTLKFKTNEKEHYVKLKEFQGDDTSREQEQRQDDQFFALELEKQDSTKYKDEEINHLVKSINDLAGIFKDLSVMVVE